MRGQHFSLLILFCLVFIQGCDENEIERTYPRVITQEVTNISADFGAKFSGQLTIPSSSSVIEHGFIWGIDKNVTFENGLKVNLGAQENSKNFDATIESDLMEAVTYYVKAYAKTEDLTIYGNEVIFRSLGSLSPKINSIFPSNANLLDTIGVTGKHFSREVDSIEVKFNDISSEVIYASTDSLIILVPQNLTSIESTISVEVLGNVTYSDSKFELNPPRIISFTPQAASINDTITVFGENYLKENTKVLLAGEECEIIYVINNKIKFLYPEDPENSLIEIKVIDQSTTSKDTLFNSSPILFDYYPKNGFLNDTLTFSGDFPADVNVQIRIDDMESEVVSVSDTEIQFIVPDGVASASANVEVLVKTLNYTYHFNDIQAFRLFGPAVTSLSSETAYYGDELSIQGNYFSPTSEVYFENNKAEIISISDEEIVVVVPDIPSRNSNLFIVSLQQESNRNTFSLLTPKIQSINKSDFIIGDQVTLTGSFNPNLGLNRIYVDNNEVNTFEISESEVTFGFPIPDFNVLNHKIEIVSGSFSDSIDGIMVQTPELSLEKDFRIGIGDTIKIISNNGIETLIGQKFGVTIESDLFNSVVTENGQLEVVVDKYLGYDQPNLNVIIGGKAFSVHGQLSFPWKKVGDLNVDQGHHRTIMFYANEKLYLGIYFYGNSVSNSRIEIYEFNEELTQYTLVNIHEFPLLKFEPSIAFTPISVDEFVYIGFRNSGEPYSRFWEIDLVNFTWKQNNEYPLRFEDGYSFYINNSIYVGPGRILSPGFETQEQPFLWRYDIETDSWTEQSDLPAIPIVPISFSINDYAYLSLGNSNLFRYDTKLSSWSKMVDFPESLSQRGQSGVAFSTNDFGFVSRGSKSTYKFDPIGNNWTRDASLGDDLKDLYFELGYSFRKNDKIYVVAIPYQYKKRLSLVVVESMIPEIWEFDPN